MSLLKLINRKEQKSINEDFERIVAENYRCVYALALRLTGSTFDAEDITQEVFMKFYKSSSSFRGESRVSTLLYRITYNHTIDLLRRRKPQPCELREEIVAESTDEGCSYEDKMQQLDRAISQLPPDERAIITLFYMDNKSVEEISKVATISVANVKVRLHRIRKKLHTLIEERYYE